jgi:hypothetical protein
LQHTRDAQRAPIAEARQQRHEQAEPEQNQASLDDVTGQLALRVAAGQPLAERDRHGDTDDEQEEREDQIGGRPAVPLGVQKRRVDVGPAAGVVDEDHPGDGCPAKGI